MPRLAAGHFVDHDRPGRLQPGAPDLLVRFEVVPLGPLVPGEEEDEVLLLGNLGNAAYRLAQTVLVGLGRGSCVHRGAGAPAGRIVPADHDRRELFPIGAGPVEMVLDRRRVVDHVQSSGAPDRSDYMDLLILYGHEPDGGVHSVRFRTAPRRTVALDVTEVQVGYAQLLRLVAPDGKRPL